MVKELGASVLQRDLYILDIRKGYRYLPRQMRRLLGVDSLLRGVLRADWGRAVSDETTPATRWWRNAAGARHRASAGTIMQTIQIDDIVVDTLPQFLRTEDRSSMAFSLEARVPLLDRQLVEYGLSLPDDMKIRNGWSKFAVRETVRGLMPDTVRLRRTKLGFAAPDRHWLMHELRPHVRELMADDLRCHRYVDPAAIRQWYDSAQSTRANTESYLGLFRILALEMWMRAFRIS
jgi:hypothetical protein